MGEATVVRESRLAVPRPFLKWVGGKGLLLPELMERVALAGEFGRYHEPMLGGGALFFALYREGLLERQAWLSDVNPRLMETYGTLRDDARFIIFALRERQSLHSREYYYSTRESKNPINERGAASRFIYLNKTCFNGLYRENAKGEFNVPMGKYKNPAICDEENLEAVSTALRTKAKLFCGDFAEVLGRVEAGDFVYLDPPYVPVSQTANFTSYHAGGFGLDQHQVLADVFCRLHEKGAKVLLSNSDTDLVRDLYQGFTIEEVRGARSVSCKGDGRGKARDLLVRNF